MCANKLFLCSLLKDKPNFKFEYRGPLEFKNVSQPVPCWFLIENTEKEDFGPIVVADEHNYEGFIVQPTSPPTPYSSTSHQDLDPVVLHNKLVEVHRQKASLPVPDILVSRPTPNQSPRRSPVGSPRRAQSPPTVPIDALVEGLKGMCPMMMAPLPEEEVGVAGEGRAQHVVGVTEVKVQHEDAVDGRDAEANGNKVPEAVAGVIGAQKSSYEAAGNRQVARSFEEHPDPVTMEKRVSLESDVSSIADIADTSSHHSYDAEPWKNAEGIGADGLRKISNTSVSSVEEEHPHSMRSRSGSVHDRVQYFDSLGRIRRTGVVNNALAGKSPPTTVITGAMTYEDAYVPPTIPLALVTDKSSTLPRMKVSVNITEPERPNRKSLDSQGSSGSGDPE